jgi:hypothetical protein
VLDARLAPDMFICGQQMVTAMSFALRTAFPLAGRDVPRSPDGLHDATGVLLRLDAARAALRSLDPEEFARAGARRISHRVGLADLDQGAAEFLHLFGMPNFLCHLSMAFAVLRANGFPWEKPTSTGCTITRRASGSEAVSEGRGGRGDDGEGQRKRARREDGPVRRAAQAVVRQNADRGVFHRRVVPWRLAAPPRVRLSRRIAA